MTDWKKSKLVVIDFETSGLSPMKDRIVEIGIAWFEAGELLIQEDWLVNPEVPLSAEVQKIHGLTDADLKDAPTFNDVFETVLPFLKDAIPAAYNAPFDRGFLTCELERAAVDVVGNVPLMLQPTATWIDPLIWVREFQKYEKGKKLTDACRRLGIDIGKAHSAGADAVAAGRVLYALAPKLPDSYEELVAKQSKLGPAQERDFAAWRSRQPAAKV